MTTLVLIRISAAVAARDRDGTAQALSAAATLAETKRDFTKAVDEVLLQSILFVGYPAALDAMALWKEHRASPPVPSSDDSRVWTDRGARLCESVYGDQYGPLRDNIRELHPDADEWMVTHGYGRVLGRPGLDLISRELSIVAQLAVQGATRQLYSHARGALRLGASPKQVEGALDAARPWIGDDLFEQVSRVWSDVRSRHELAAVQS